MRFLEAAIFIILSLERLTLGEEIFKGKRICYNCSSDDIPKCLMDPGETMVKVCEDPGDECIVGIRGTTTLRGCISEVKNLNFKKSCNSTKCNNFVYPDNHLLCYQCKNCTTLSTIHTQQPCLKYELHDECYTDVVNVQETNRGCKSDLSTHSKYIQFCSSSGCNNQTGAVEQSCILCNSLLDKSCIKIGPSEDCSVEIKQFCEETNLLGHDSRTICYTFNKFGHVERGCINTADIPKIDEDYYEFCNNSNDCNNKCIKSIKCYKCDADDKQCQNSHGNSSLEICPDSNSCYTCKHADGSITRGCVDPNKSDMPNNCVFCQDSDGCNSGNPLICYNCNSNTDPNCAQWINSSEINYEACTNPAAKCGIIIQDMATIRGCFPPDGILSQKNDVKSFTCTTDLCNAGVYPETRRRCHICSKSKDCALAQDAKTSAVCPNYSTDTFCIFYADTNNEMIRTCSSDHSEMKKCEETVGLKCIHCRDKDDCNNAPLMLDPKLTCIKCKGAECAWGQRNDTATKCLNKFPYYLPETCITKLVDGKVERGCTLDVGTCFDERCKMCEGDACNVQTHLVQECIQCNSSNHKTVTCIEGAEELPAQVCKNPVILYEQRGCYTKRAGEVVIRGCAVDLSEKDLKDCKRDDNLQCDYCEGNGCNMKKAPSSAHLDALIPRAIIVCYLVAQFIA